MSELLELVSCLPSFRLILPTTAKRIIIRGSIHLSVSVDHYVLRGIGVMDLFDNIMKTLKLSFVESTHKQTQTSVYNFRGGVINPENSS